MVPRIVIAGTHSGCGKTSIASGIMAALVARGLAVQPFKVGPDFIDPSHHTAICRRPSRNLDPFMMGEEGVAATFARAAAGADIAVIEGVMGMFDGLEGSDFGSTAHVARILAAPLVLVADVRGASRSANAMVKGYREFDPTVPFGGVIYNRVGSFRHRAMIEEGSPDRAFGWVPWQRDGAVESRHLGLQMAHETDRMGGFGAVVEECCDMDALIGLAQSAPPLNAQPEDRDDTDGPRVRIGVAWDEAFCFYYQDNFDLLRRMGADLIFFSPMADALPAADALYFGGGYPELHAGRLEKAKCRMEIRRALDDGMPAYGECGGLVYLSERMKAGGEWSMVGVLPAEAEKMDRFQALGYVDASCAGKNPFFAPGTGIRGHEFHYTRVTYAPDARFALRLSRGEGIGEGRDGLFEHNVLAGYTHAYFTPEVAGAIVGAARKARRA
ncbi:MAG TPA: cobyrinate a,c-diamide synthase [Methanoculleus sp.]|nr:cobyrinate a,c-diamide synthase [Methanoculleus sp.]